MRAPDFELGGRIRARGFRSATPPQPATEGENARLETLEQRRGLAGGAQPGRVYEEVTIAKRLRGYVEAPKATV